MLPLIIGSCDSKITFPAVSETPTQTHNAGQFVWHDLATYDPLTAVDFYSKLFDWTFDALGDIDNTYYVIKNNGKPIGGMFKLAASYGEAAEWISSISVDNVDAAVKYNSSAGGKTIYNKANFVGRGETALVQDPQNAFVAFLYSESGDPNPQRTTTIDFNGWLWDELWSNDINGSINYYKGLVGYVDEEVPEAKQPYFLFKKDKYIFSGIINMPVQDARSAWMPYIKVRDVHATVEKAKALGAHIMLEPDPSIRKGTVAVIMDPTGGQFTVQQWILR